MMKQYTVRMNTNNLLIISLFLFSSIQAKDEDKTNYFLFGLLCGLALYNQLIIHLPFPLALFKKLLGVEPTLEDMMEFSPGVGK